MAFEFVGKTIKATVSSGASAVKQAAVGTAEEYLGPKAISSMGDVFSKVSSGIGKQIEKSQSTSMSAIGGQIAKSQLESSSSLGGEIEKSQGESTYRMVQATGEVEEAVNNLREALIVSGEQSEFQLKKLRGDMDGGEGFFGRYFGKQSRIGRFFSGIGKVLGMAARGFGAVIGVVGKEFGALIGKAGAGLASMLGKFGPALGKVGKAAAPVAAVAAAGVAGFAVGTWLNKQIDKAFGEKGGLGKWVFDFLHDPETGIFARAGKLFGEAWAGAKSLVGDVAGTVGGWITGGLKVIGAALSWENIVNISGKINDWINEGMTKVKEKLSWENIIDVSGKVREWISIGLAKFSEKLSWENIVNVSAKIGEWVSEGLAKIKEKFSLEGVFQGLADFIKWLGGILSLDNMIDAVKKAAGKVGGRVGDLISESVTKVKEKLSWENTVGKVGSLLGKPFGLGGTEKEAVQVENLVQEQEVRRPSTQKQADVLVKQKEGQEGRVAQATPEVAKPVPITAGTTKITPLATALMKDKSVGTSVNVTTDNKETVGLLGSIKDLLTRVLGTKEPETMRDFRDDPLAAFLGSGRL